MRARRRILPAKPVWLQGPQNIEHEFRGGCPGQAIHLAEASCQHSWMGVPGPDGSPIVAAGLAPGNPLLAIGGAAALWRRRR